MTRLTFVVLSTAAWCSGAACCEPRREVTSSKPSSVPSTPSSTVSLGHGDAGATARAQVTTGWTKTEDGWARGEGRLTEPLVVRGVLRPESPYGVVGGACGLLIGGRASNPPVVLRIPEGVPSQPLYAFVKARGPVGIGKGATGEDCKVAGANTWARVELGGGSVSLVLVDADVAGERRGQTSPFVLVIHDKDETPTLEPAERAPTPPGAAIVRWQIEPIRCSAENETWARSCYRARLELSGPVKRQVPLRRQLAGQVDCFPDGLGVMCGGASGATTISLVPASGDTLAIRATSESDGYCPPPEDCKTTETLQTIPFPRGVTLVPDPAGTWPARK